MTDSGSTPSAAGSGSAPIVRAAVGAAYLAGLAVGFWRGTDELASLWRVQRRFEPALDEARRAESMAQRRRAVERARHRVQ